MRPVGSPTTPSAMPNAGAPAFGHTPVYYPHESYPADAYRPTQTPSNHYSIGKRLQLGLKNAVNGKNLRKSFFRSLLLFLLSLPTAALIPGPQLAVIPVSMGIGATLRFLKGLKNPAKVAKQLDNQ